MDRIGFQENEPIEHSMVTKAIENAQKRVEAQNFEIRKHLLEYDNVMNRQRQVIYEQRKRVLKGDELWADLEDMVEEVAEIIVAECIDEKAHPDEWNIEGLDELVYKQFSLRLGLKERVRQMSVEQIVEEISQAAMAHLRAKEERFSAEVMSYLIKMIMLQSIDNHWKDHLLMMDHLREGIGLRGYGQKDPVREYQKEGYEMFMDMTEQIKRDVVEKLCMVQVANVEELEDIAEDMEEELVYSHSDAAEHEPVRSSKKVGRNDPCPCGSGKKYKKCCGR